MLYTAGYHVFRLPGTQLAHVGDGARRLAAQHGVLPTQGRLTARSAAQRAGVADVT